MNTIRYIFLLFAFSLSLKADIIIDQLINKTHKIQWYMFQATTGTVTRNYLVNNRDTTEAGGMRVWNLTNDRKWRPISNAKTFDGFVGTAKNFKTITIDANGNKITFGEKSISKNIPLDTYLNDLENKTFDIKWYYWITANGFPFLIFNRDSVSGISVYQHTANGKWKPIHNAREFDGYPKANSVFNEIIVSSDGREVTINYNKFNIPTITDVLPRETIVKDFRISSNNFSDDTYKSGTQYNLTSNPHIDWTNPPANAPSLAIEIINLQDKKAIWRAINIAPGDSNTSYIPAGSSVTYRQMTTLENDYDFKKEFYKGTNHSGSLPSGDYLVTLYALSTTSSTTIADAKKHAIEYVNLVFKGP